MGKKFDSILGEMESLIGDKGAYSLKPQDFIEAIGAFIERLRSDALDGLDEESSRIVPEHSDGTNILASPLGVVAPIQKIREGLDGSLFLHGLADAFEECCGCPWIPNSTICEAQRAYGHCDGKCLETCIIYQDIANRLRKCADSFDKCRKNRDEYLKYGLDIAKYSDMLWAKNNNTVKGLKNRIKELEGQLNSQKGACENEG